MNAAITRLFACCFVLFAAGPASADAFDAARMPEKAQAGVGAMFR